MPKTAHSGGKSPSSLSWRYLLLFLFLVALFFFVPTVLGWLEGVGQTLVRTFGVGLTLLAVSGLIFFALRGWLSLLRRWHRWLGGAALVLALFGTLSFFRTDSGLLREASLGGRLGQLITGPATVVGVVRVLVLFYLSALLLVPAATLSLSRKGVRGLWWLLQGLLSLVNHIAARFSRPAAEEQLPAPSEGEPRRPPPKLVTETSAKERGPKGTALKELTGSLRGEAVASTAHITPSGWQVPGRDILELEAAGIFGPGDVERRGETLQRAMEEYGVEGTVVGWNVGPTVTQFEVEPGWDVKYREMREKDKNGSVRLRRQEVSRTRVKVDRITALSNDLALALAAPSIRIEAPVPGKSIVGIEVPNSSLGVVPLRSVLESTNFQKLSAKSPLALALGKGVGGESIVADLARMPHLLVAGATGSGKTVCLNAIISCLAMHNTPDDLQLMLIDPKRVEFTSYAGLPHLVSPVVVDREKAVEALRWLSTEMDNRYRQLSAAGARNIDGYNRSRRSGAPMPCIVLVVDELADLMMVNFEEVEQNLCRLAQLARATGIHLVVATQRPSVDVVTGLIKANFPTRISFALSSQVDSRTILDCAGAEKLLGRGDMLYLPTDAPKPKRLQGCFVSDAEIERLVNFWLRQRRPATPAPSETAPTSPPAPTEPRPPADPLLEAARRLAAERKQLSPSYLSRHLQVGYSRAVKLLELLEAEGKPTGKRTDAEKRDGD